MIEPLEQSTYCMCYYLDLDWDHVLELEKVNLYSNVPMVCVRERNTWN